MEDTSPTPQVNKTRFLCIVVRMTNKITTIGLISNIYICVHYREMGENNQEKMRVENKES